MFRSQVQNLEWKEVDLDTDFNDSEEEIGEGDSDTQFFVLVFLLIEILKIRFLCEYVLLQAFVAFILVS